MKRRDFLRYLAGATCAAGSFTFKSPLQPYLRAAQAATNKTLVVVFQRGGCDGLNAVVPYGDDDYYRLRPKIAVASPNAANSESAVDLNGFFGLHPSLASFLPIFQNGDMAILPTVHYENASLSHFDSQALIESGSTNKTDVGWISRHLDAHQPSPDEWSAINFGYSTSHSMRGSEQVSTFNDLADLSLGVPDDQQSELMDILNSVYQKSINGTNPYLKDIAQAGSTMLEDINKVAGVDLKGYAPANGAQYPSSTLGNQLMQSALLIKSGMNPRVITINSGGWDTHINQGAGNPDGRQAKQFSDFSNSLAAFYSDLGANMNNVIVLTMTEFGRTAKENGNGGTDHGNASAWFVMGKSLRGGLFTGNSGWPGLADNQLVDGRSLAHTIDYRDIMAELLTHHLNNPQINTILPNHHYTPVGFM